MVSEAQVLAMLQDLAERIERGGIESATFRITTDEGETEYTFSLRTEEERIAALVAIRRMLGQLH